ncbi:MAG: hypothetical protein WBE83_11440 [Candidatus Cybelea sp.]
MGLLFKDALHDSFGTWALGYIPYGGADFGEVQAVARTVGEGDDGAFYEAWTGTDDRLVERGKEALAKGRRASASDAFLRAACHFGSSYHPSSALRSTLDSSPRFESRSRPSTTGLRYSIRRYCRRASPTGTTRFRRTSFPLPAEPGRSARLSF